MKNIKLSDFWNELNASYWFLPSAMMLGSIALASAPLFVDRLYGEDIEPSWIYTGRPDGVRESLSVIASSTIGVAERGYNARKMRNRKTRPLQRSDRSRKTKFIPRIRNADRFPDYR